MLRIIWLQFKHSWKAWFAALFLFIVTGFLTGTCLNGIFTIADHFSHLSRMENPSDIFYYPMIFGVITLFIVSSGVIKLVINSMSKEYTLWTILGANPNQLAILIGGQLALLGAIGAFIGFIFAVPFTVALDMWVTNLTGFVHMPIIPLEFSIPACFWTVAFIFTISGMAGYLHSHKLFVNSQTDILNFKKRRSKFQSITHLLLILISALGLIVSYGNSLIVTSQAQHYLALGNSHEAGKTYTQNLMIIMLLSIILFALVAQLILPKIIKFWTRILPRQTSATVNTAYWNTMFDKNYLSSLIAPLLGGSFLLTGITYITSGITNGGTNQEATANSIASLVIFLGAPLLIILANVLVITVIVSKQQRINLNQLFLLGFTSTNAIVERIMEAVIYAVTFFICGVIGNLPLYLTVYRIEVITHKPITVSWLSTMAWPAGLFGIILIFVAAVGGWHVLRFEKSAEKQM